MNRLLIALVSAGLLVGAGYLWGVRAEKNAVQAQQLRTVVGTIKKHDAAAVVGNAVEQETVRAETRQSAFTRKLTQETRAHVKAPTTDADKFRLDADLLYRWTAANRGATADSTGLSDRSAGGGIAAAARESDLGRSDGEPHRNGGDVSPAAGTLPRPGEVAGDDDK